MVGGNGEGRKTYKRNATKNVIVCYIVRCISGDGRECGKGGGGKGDEERFENQCNLIKIGNLLREQRAAENEIASSGNANRGGSADENAPIGRAAVPFRYV